jgi:putative addiction module component (TIGR02574 family)
LSPEERVRLLDLLLESLQSDAAPANDDAWAREIARRVADHDRGDGELHDMDDVLAEARHIAP